jgi:hypothetical protein
MVPGEVLIYALLIGLGVGMLIGRTWGRQAPPEPDDRIIIVVAPSVAEGREAAAKVREVYARARALRAQASRK